MTGRLSLALERGIVTLPEGEVLVLEPATDTDLSGFERDRTTVYAGSASVHAALVKDGWKTDPPVDPFEAVIIFLPRAKDAARALLRRARHLTNGPIIVDGDKTNGVDSFFRDVKQRADVSEAWSKAHGKVFTVTGGDFSDWPDFAPFRAADGWWRAPGVFSADGIDKASAFLAENLPNSLSGSVVDLGAGWGFLSRTILECTGVTALHLVEDSYLAIRAAEKNVVDDRAAFHAADALTWRPKTPVDHVVSNPPFQVGRSADPALGQAFIRAAAAMLKPKGQLWLVANRHLPYESTLEDAFRTVQTLTQTPSFKIFHATSPKPRRKG